MGGFAAMGDSQYSSNEGSRMIHFSVGRAHDALDDIDIEKGGVE